MTATTRSRGLAPLTATTVLLATAACTREANPDPGSKDKGGLTRQDVPDETNYWISENSTLPLFVANDYPGWEAAVEQLGVKAERVGPTNIDLAAFIATIEQVCAQEPAGVAAVGWDPSLIAAVDKCVEAGVPTITVDADLPESKRLTFVGTDWYQIGVAQAEAMMAATEPGQVATLSIINAANMIDARQGFADTLESTGSEIVANEDDSGGSDMAASKTSSLLAAYPNLVGIAGFDSESGTGIVTALTEADRVGKVALTAMEHRPEFFQSRGPGRAVVSALHNLHTTRKDSTVLSHDHDPRLRETHAAPARRVDHVAIATLDADAAAQWYVTTLGMVIVGDEVINTAAVRLVYLATQDRDPGGTLIQLAEPTGPGSVFDFVEKVGEGLHHLCFTVDNIDDVLDGVQQPRDRIFLGGRDRRACFLDQQPLGVLIELTETAPASERGSR